MSKVQIKLCVFLVLFIGFQVSITVNAGADNILTVEDCVKCHEEQPNQINAKGASHKTEIDCQSCHEGHRPMSENNIPQCSDCHEGSNHYEVDNCLGCHDPHAPLEVKLDGEHKSVCISCHSGPNEEMLASPSMHADFACNFCHADMHGNIPECVDCHEPHSVSMTQANCVTCHQAHKPLELTYPDDTSSELCGACHETALTTLRASKTKHGKIGCVTCHTDKHKMIPECSDCHGQPHATSMHQKFPNCADCHNVAHDLSN